MDIKDMVGKVFDTVRMETGIDIASEDGDKMIFENAEERFTFYHQQDCCEFVRIEDISGDLSDLIGEPLLMAEDVSGMVTKPANPPFVDEYNDSYTYTFYKFATRKGYVDVRWFGESNGFYSEEVSLKHEKLGEVR